MPEPNEPTTQENSSQEEQEEQIEEVTAIDFANEARDIIKQSNNWKETKDSMKEWLQTKVGANVSTALENLNDLIIKSAKNVVEGDDDEGKNGSVHYLKDAKSHLLSLVKNPYERGRHSGNPPRGNGADNINGRNDADTVAAMIGWWIDPKPNRPTSRSDEQENTGD